MAEAEQRPWGKINRRQPYVVITRDLLRAFFHAKMNAAERAVFEYVLEHSWGDATMGKRGGDPWPDALPCEMNLFALATALNIDYANMKKARNALVADRILICSDDRFFINKDVDTWPESRITGHSLEHAAEAIRTGRLPETNNGPLGVNHTPNTDRYNVALGVNGTPNCMDLGVNHTPNATKRVNDACRPPDPPIRNAGADAGANVFNSEKREEKRPAPASVDDGLEPFESAPDAHPLPSSDVSARKMSPAIEGALDVAREAWPEAHHLHRAIINLKDGHPAAWYLPAVLILRRKKRPQQTLSYFMGILRSFAAQGGPDLGGDSLGLATLPQVRPSEINRPDYMVPLERPAPSGKEKSRP